MDTADRDDLVLQAPPTKRARLDAADDNDFEIPIPADMANTTGDVPATEPVQLTHTEGGPSNNTSATYSGIPGLGLLGNAPKEAESSATVGITSASQDALAQSGTELGSEGDQKGTTVPQQPQPNINGSSMDIDASETAAKEGTVTENLGSSLDASEVAISSNQTNTADVDASSQAPGNDNSAPNGMQDVEKRKDQETQEITASNDVAPTEPSTRDTEMMDRAPSPLPLTHALESLLERHVATAAAEQAAAAAQLAEGDEGDEGAEAEHPEWEIDSSPYESSSDDSSSDDSSSEDSDEEGNTYQLLTPEEQARILMEGDLGSDDEGGSKGAKGTGSQLRTKNEIAEEVIPKPDVTITPEMPIVELGNVEAVVEGYVLIKAKTTGEYRVLESGSVLCLEDRTVIGAVSETLGRVEEPLYCLRFANETEIAEAGITVGKTIFYSEQHSTFVFTQALKAFKGSDASNLHDEEVADEEMEFSDDEAEMEHKRKLKQKKQEKRGGKAQQGGGRGPHPLQQSHGPPGAGAGLSYDDGEEDGPYKTLSRPAGFAESVGRTEAPQESAYRNRSENSSRGGRNREFNSGRGRGDRGRDRGNRFRGPGGNSQYQDRRSEGTGYSQPQGSPYTQQPQLPPGNFIPPSPQGRGYSLPPQGVPVPPPNFYPPPQNQYSPQQPQLWQQYPPQTSFQQQPQQGYQPPHQSSQQGWPNAPPPMPLPGGAFINPAFFPGSQQSNSPNQWNQPGQPGGKM